MNNRMCISVATAVVALASVVTSPASADVDALNPRALYLKQGVVEFEARADVRTQAAPFVGRKTRSVLQLDGPMTPDRRQALEKVGVVLEEYLPANAYIVRLEHADADALGGLGVARAVIPFQRAWKLDPELGLRPFETARRLELAAGGRSQIVVTLFEGEATDAAVAEIVARGGAVISQSQAGDRWLIDATMPTAGVNGLADVETVQFIEDAPEGTFRNDTNRWVLQSNQLNVTPVWDAGITGLGQVAGIIDGTIREGHCSFDDSVPVGPTHRKIIAIRNSGISDFHGTHVSGTLAGDQTPYGVPDQFDGIAYEAKITFTNVDPIYNSPGTLYARLLDAHNDGGRVHSNSWGDDGTTAYTTWSRQIDDFSYDFEESLVALAVTNLSTLRTPENAKNVLAVGASRDTPLQDSFCSGGRGPTADGRRKPEIFAPGCSTQSSTNSTCGFSGLTGTSMACPAISGAGILARQYYTDGFYPTGVAENDPLIPSGALIKATLLNAGVDMTNISGYPSDQEGWGRLLLDNTLYFPGDLSRLQVADVRNADGLSTGGETDYPFVLGSSAAPLKITLVFTEPPAAINASNPVINNLDLEVTAPGGEVYRGNWFSGGQSTTGGSADAKNNVERIILSSPAAGGYIVTIKGTAVNQGTQGYALVINGDINFDCNDNGVDDSEDIANQTSEDCNGNGIPDECEPDEDCNMNSVQDICDIAQGPSSDDDGNGIPDECEATPPLSAPVPHNIRKNRYISLVPDQGDDVVAFRVEMTSSTYFPASTGVLGWVGEPVEIGCPNNCSGDFVAPVVSNPVYRAWPEPVVHVGDCEIVPVAVYNIRSTVFGELFSEPLVVGTILKPVSASWADCVGPLIEGSGWTAPDGATNFDDVTAAVMAFQRVPGSFWPHVTAVDLHGDDLPPEQGGASASPPNRVVNFTDVQFIVLAFEGGPYPFNDPADCPQEPANRSVSRVMRDQAR